MTTKLAFETFGQKNLPAIVFLHGGGSSSWSWHPVVALLQADYFCLVPDLPQHGGSAQVKPFSMERAADEITALIRSEVPARKAVIVGLSEGAQVGVSLLARAPDQVEFGYFKRRLVKTDLLPPVGSRQEFYAGVITGSSSLLCTVIGIFAGICMPPLVFRTDTLHNSNRTFK